jgi:anti-anti-sigma factor
VTSAAAERGLGGGDHVCLVHDSHVERLRLLEAHVASAFDAGERILALRESSADHDLSDLFGRTGRGSRRGQFDVRNASDVYLAAGAFDPDGVLASLESAKHAALADGFTGLRILAEMDWAAAGAANVARLAAYEHAVNGLVADGRASAVCQYDRTRFDTGVVADCAAAHGSVESAFDPDQVIEDGRVAIDVGAQGTIRARGEIDLSNAELLERALAIAASRSHDVWVDASGLTFIDVCGLHALLEAARSSSVALLAPPPSLRGMLDALDVRRHEPGLGIG